MRRMKRAIKWFCALSALGFCRVSCCATDGCAYCEPDRIAAQASPECSTLGGCDGGLALIRERCHLDGVVGKILLRDGNFGLAHAAILDVVVERLQVGGRNLR